MVELLRVIAESVLTYIVADWWILLIGMVMAVSIRVYVDVGAFRSLIERNNRISIGGSVAVGSFTPLCACGTMAVIISMFVSAMPWGPVMAFLVSSPLTSPSEYMFQVAFLGSEFALAMLVASVLMGILAGAIASYLERRTGFFHSQLKVGETEASSGISCCRETTSSSNLLEKLKLKEFFRVFVEVGVKRILLYFAVFIAIGTLVERLVPKEWILALFSGDRSYSIPLAATLGLPLHVSGAASLPLLRSIANAGAGPGAVLAFLIAGKATGIPVIVGLSTFLRKRALGFYVAFVYVSGIVAGYLYQLLQ